MVKHTLLNATESHPGGYGGKKQGEEEFVSFIFPVHRWVTYIIFSFNYMIIYVSKSKNNDLFYVEKYLTC